MEPWGIAVIIIVVVLGLYFAYCLLVVFAFNYKLLGKRGSDPDNPCYLRFEDYKDLLVREEYSMIYDRVEINGYIYKNIDVSKRNKGFIILSHGFFGTHVQYLLDIAFLCSNGYVVLAYDQYGCGMSLGKSQYSLATGVYLLDSVIKDVEKRKLNGDLPLILYGHSWGGYCVAGAMRNHKEIKACVSRSAFIDPIVAAEDILKSVNKAVYYTTLPLIRFCSLILIGKKHMIKSTSGLKKNNITPTLFIYALDDKMISNKNSLALYYKKHTQSNAYIFIQNTGDHNSILKPVGQTNYAEAVKKYREIVASDDKDKIAEFKNSLDRVSMYPYNTDCTNEILNFLDSNIN